MTPRYILRASLCRRAACYSAWVQGEGYVNKGDGTVARHSLEDYMRQWHHDANNEIDNMLFAEGYAGYLPENQPKRCVLFANWNLFPDKVIDLLERQGYAIEWSDEWSICDSCNMAVRTEPDSFCYRAEYQFVESDGAMLCLDCLQEEYGDPVMYEEEEV